MKKYIVTGAAGYLGSTILRELEGKDCEVRALIKKGQKPVIKADNIEYRKGDILDRSDVGRLLAGFDGDDTALIHCAAITDLSDEPDPEMEEVNVTGTQNLLRAAKKRPVGMFVFVSSAMAMPPRPNGETRTDIKKFFPDELGSAYAHSKAAASREVLIAAKKHQNTVVVLPSVFIGPYNDGSSPAVGLVKDCITGNLHTQPAGAYDFVDVRDVAKGCLDAAEKGKSGECYILCGHSSTVADMLAMTGCSCTPDAKSPAVWKLSLRLGPQAVPRRVLQRIARRSRRSAGMPAERPAAPQEMKVEYGAEKAEKYIGYSVRPLEETVADTVDWLKENR